MLIEIVELMLGLLPDREKLGADPEGVSAREFGTLRLVELARGSVPTTELCACDGYYDAETFDVPVICYRSDVSPRRSRFTILHELGHHLIRTVEPVLLDLIDEAAPPAATGMDGAPLALRDVARLRRNPDQIEERVCEQFAAQVLISDSLLESIVADGLTGPEQVHDLYRRSGASWQACALRLAGRIGGHSAIILIRRTGIVDFVAASPAVAIWPGGSRVAPGGALDRALEAGATGVREIYRYDLAGAEEMWCDIRQPWHGMAVAVLSDHARPGRLNLTVPVEVEWGRLYCLRCGELREGDWCYDCRGARCTHCGACGCWSRPKERRCEGQCGLLKGLGAFNEGRDVCRDCDES